MTFVTCTLHWNGATGNWSLDDSGHEYTAVYRCTVADPLEQAHVIISAFEGGVVALGTIYRYANDPPDPFSVAKKIGAKRELGTTNVWVVTVSYGPLSDEEGEDPEGEPTQNPLEYCPEVTWQTQLYQKPVERSQFQGGFKGKALAAVPVGTWIIPMNSALVPFNPGLEMDDTRGLLRITRNYADLDADKSTDLTNKVNDNNLQLDFKKLKKQFLTWSLKIKDISIVRRKTNGVDYWEQSIAYDWDGSPFGHAKEVVDRGMMTRAIPGDPRGDGSEFGQNDMIHGKPYVIHATDADETSLSDPVLFDGDGRPLDMTETPIKPVYLLWLHYQEIDLSGTDQVQGIITNL